MSITTANGPTPAATVAVLDLAVEDLESLDAPSVWAWAAGFAAGLAVGALIAT